MQVFLLVMDPLEIKTTGSSRILGENHGVKMVTSEFSRVINLQHLLILIQMVLLIILVTTLVSAKFLLSQQEFQWKIHALLMLLQMIAFAIPIQLQLHAIVEEKLKMRIFIHSETNALAQPMLKLIMLMTLQLMLIASVELLPMVDPAQNLLIASVQMTTLKQVQRSYSLAAPLAMMMDRCRRTPRTHGCKCASTP